MNDISLRDYNKLLSEFKIFSSLQECFSFILSNIGTNVVVACDYYCASVMNGLLGWRIINSQGKTINKVGIKFQDLKIKLKRKWILKQ